WAQTISGQSFPQYQPNPLLDYSLPELAAGNVARNLGMALDLGGWASLTPLALVVLVGMVMLFRSAEKPLPAAEERWVENRELRTKNRELRTEN
ncbi:MAG: hypothetical protein NZM94_01135, partial [Roseiflexus sp.]|nr:hypothetical protein [Roseiflexus sp.]